jgi:hypothetical protein
MEVKKVEIELPLDIYLQLEQVAEASEWPMEHVLMQVVKSGLPPTLSKVPEDFQADLLELNKLTDQDLLRVVEGDLPGGKLDERRKKAGFDTLRRTYALSLLRWRGHPVPKMYEAFIGV